MIFNKTIEMKQGEALTLNFTIILPDSVSPSSLSNLELRWALSIDTDRVVYKTSLVSTDIDVLDTNGGLCAVYIHKVDTQHLLPGKYKYEFWQVASDLDETPLAEGYIQIDKTNIR